MHGETGGRRSPRSDLDGSRATGGRRTGANVGLPRVAPGRHRVDCRTPTNLQRARWLVPSGMVRCTLAGSRVHLRAPRIEGSRACELAIRDPAAHKAAQPAGRHSAWARSHASHRHRSPHDRRSTRHRRPAHHAQGAVSRSASASRTSAGTCARTST
jgi:hypothetical protein